MQYLIVVPVILMSIIFHEISHGYAALILGDETAKINRRLSFNPVNHIDPFGTVILPILLLLATRGALVFGYAKPVPINPNNFSYDTRKRDIGITAAAGPLSNIVVAIVFSIGFRILASLPIGGSGTVLFNIVYFFAEVFLLIVFFNLILAFFNLIPIPPLDGSKILGAFLPNHLYYRFMVLERQGMLIFMAIIFASYFFGWNIIGRLIFPPVNLAITILTGTSLF